MDFLNETDEVAFTLWKAPFWEKIQTEVSVMRSSNFNILFKNESSQFRP